MPETNIVTTNTSIDDIRNFMNFVFHDKSPGASVFACMGGTDAGVLFRSTMGMGKKATDLWLSSADKNGRPNPLTFAIHNKNVDLIVDAFQEVKNKCGNMENTFICSGASFSTAPNEDGRYNIKKNNKCVYAYHAVVIDIDYKDIPDTIKDHVQGNPNKLWDYFKTVNIDAGYAPYPSAVVSSGRGGLHLYWVLDKKITIPKTKNTTTKKQKQLDIFKSFFHMAQRIFLADPKVTPIQWMRLPGSVNLKEKPLPCELIDMSGCLYSLEELQNYTETTNKSAQTHPLYDYWYSCSNTIKPKSDEYLERQLKECLAREYEIKCIEYGWPLDLEETDVNTEIEKITPTNVVENRAINNANIQVSGHQCTDEWIYFNKTMLPKMKDYNEIKTAHYVTARDLAEILVNRRDFEGSGRNTYLFYIGINIAFSLTGKSFSTISDEVSETLTYINGMLQNPLDDSEIYSISSQIDKQYMKYYGSNERYETKKGFVMCPKEMLLSSPVLCRILNISNEDCKYTKHLMTKAEAKRRKSIRNKANYETMLAASGKVKKSVSISSRREKIAELIRNQKYLVKELAKKFEVSLATIKRDIKYISEQVAEITEVKEPTKEFVTPCISIEAEKACSKAIAMSKQNPVMFPEPTMEVTSYAIDKILTIPPSNKPCNDVQDPFYSCIDETKETIKDKESINTDVVTLDKRQHSSSWRKKYIDYENELFL